MRRHEDVFFSVHIEANGPYLMRGSVNRDDVRANQRHRAPVEYERLDEHDRLARTSDLSVGSTCRRNMTSIFKFE